MKNEYVSSILSNYGDIDSVKQDATIVNEILSRQGSKFLIDVLAESVGTTANKFKLTSFERETLIDNLICELSNVLRERL